MACPACLLVLLRAINVGVPTVIWALPHQTSVKKRCTTGLPTGHLMGTCPQLRVPFSKLLSGQVDIKLVSTDSCFKYLISFLKKTGFRVTCKIAIYSHMKIYTLLYFTLCCSSREVLGQHSTVCPQQETFSLTVLSLSHWLLF